ncbi:transglutaminase family protein [Prevotella sp. 10(H)]|uniref:transglutaminase-like domain-containing protein n=1 Tax=Prevotella sp. 10(H) TaxID=1158294 RepID=UPI0004A6C8A4|nr:transglutaminase-like domain-containing protein [Prevotella sp. 10(H)]
MKYFYLFLIFLSLSIFTYAQKDKTYVVKTNTDKVKLIVNGDTSEDDLQFSKEKSDTVRISIAIEPLNISMITDIDSISVRVPEDERGIFIFQKEGMKPLVAIFYNGMEKNNISFDRINKNSQFRFIYEKGENNPYLQKLRAEYPIDSIASKGATDIEKVRHIASWVHNLWKHDGYNEPKQSDALYILEQVKQGQRFRCVEYGIVTTACLNSIGLPSRTLALKTKDVETRPSGAGHVVLEVFLKDLNKWVMVDPQWDAIAYLDGVPLNAVEFQEAVTHKKDVDIKSSDKEISKEQYKSWIYPYLYYFSYKFDNRENISREDRFTIDGKTDIMLVPVGVKKPTVFQGRFPINYCIYTNSIQDFYGAPEL